VFRKFSFVSFVAVPKGCVVVVERSLKTVPHKKFEVIYIYIYIYIYIRQYKLQGKIMFTVY